ncbi:MAG TPA: MupG family TIM beta-alpha barrel fold protein [Cellulomonas sp.]
MSVYRTDTDRGAALLDRAAGHGADLAFTSLHLPEDSPAGARVAVQALAGTARDCGLELVADIAPRTRDLLGGADAWQFLARAGVGRLRLDDGFGPAEAAEIARHLPLARNASTEPPPGPRAEAGDVLGVHNFYPRRGTGLALATVRTSASAWQADGLALGAFVSGDARRRGPLGHGLPTVEEHRDAAPAAQAAALLAAGCDIVLVGDPDLSRRALHDLARLARDGTVTLRVVPVPGLPRGLLDAVTGPDRNRPDAAAQHLRLVGSRDRLAPAVLPPVGGQPRPRGSVTVDLDDAGRYRGEVRVTLVDLPGDPTVAVVATVPAVWLPALDAVGAGQRVHLAPLGADLSEAERTQDGTRADGPGAY